MKTNITKFLWLVLVLLKAQICLSQTYTPVEYNFPSIPAFVGEDSAFTSDIVGVASNGIGNWTAHELRVWNLIADSVSTPVTTAGPDRRPSGVIDSGNFTTVNSISSLRIKVARNLAGNVRYVWPTDSGAGFYFAGFNDERDTNVANRNTDISFTGIPHAANSKDIASIIILYPQLIQPIHWRGIGAIENDWRDAFDICMDSSFLYLTWQTMGTRINLVVLRLSDHSVAWQGEFRTTDSRRRPTIACDVRNSIKPACRIVTIENVLNHGTDSAIFLPILFHTLDTSGALTTDNPFTYSYTHPISGTPTPYTTAKHARVVVSSVNGKSLPTWGIYAIVGGNTNINSATADALIFHRFEDLVETPTPANYIDGVSISPHDSPVGIGFFPMINNHIHAFANPYDGEKTKDYDEFHVLYQLSKDDTTVTGHPLFIAQGQTGSQKTIITRSNSTGGPIWQALPHPHKLANGERKYCASINQKGIHVFWKSAGIIDTGSTFYSRDLRHLDEPIEENTLITYKNVVADGEYHGGTKGAHLLPDRTLTIWSDPNFNNGWMYTPRTTSDKNFWHNGRLFFQDSGVALRIGDTVEYASNGEGGEFLKNANGAHFVTLPNFLIIFEENCNLATLNQKIIFDGISSWDYYGVPKNSLGSQILGAGTIDFDGVGVPVSCDLISVPSGSSAASSLYIHPGATFVIPDASLLKSDNVIIDHEYGSDVGVLSSPTDKTGTLQVNGSINLRYSRVYSRYDTGISGYANHIRVLPPLYSCSSLPDSQFVMNCVNFRNIPELGRAKIIFDSNTTTKNYRLVLINAGISWSTIFEFGNPKRPIIIEDLSLLHVYDKGIYIHRPLSEGLTYTGIKLERNYLSFADPVATGIRLDNFTTRRDGDPLVDLVFVSDNLIEGMSVDTVNAHGIYFHNSVGKITGNQISGLSFDDGIRLYNPDIPEENPNNSFLCSNGIFKTSQYGIYTHIWRGYAMNNVVDSCMFGHYHEPNVSGANISLSTYENCQGPGFMLSSAHQVNLRGLHDGAYSHAGQNLISHNNLSGNFGGQIELVGFSAIIVGNTTQVDSLGRNNFVRNDTTEKYIYCNDSFGASVHNTGIIKNFWATGSGTGTSNIVVANDFLNVGGISFPSEQDSVFNIIPDTIQCGDGFFQAMTKGSNPDTDTLPTADCDLLDGKIETYLNTFKYRRAYDTAKYFIEQCYNHSGAPYQFSSVSQGAYGLSLDEGHWELPAAKGWMLSVLYLNPNRLYYCKDAIEIAVVQGSLDSGRRDFREAISILQYLHDSVDCQVLNQDIKKRINALKQSQLNFWGDSVTDSIAYPPDTTTIYTLDELGVQDLRKVHSSVSESDIIAAGLLTNVFSVPNPANDETTLHFRLTDPAVLRLEIFDALGRTVLTKPLGWSSEGDHTTMIDLRGLSQGTYYARLSSLRGAVETVKVVKE